MRRAAERPGGDDDPAYIRGDREMKKKLWTGLILALLLALVCCGTATADASGTCGTNLEWKYVSDTGELFITGTGPMADYSHNYAPWDLYEKDVCEIHIADGVTSISPNAFYNCDNTQHVYIPKSVSSIGYQAFGDCDVLFWVRIYNPNAVIGDSDYDVFPDFSHIEGWKGSTAATYAAASGNEFEGWETSGQCGDNVWWSLSQDAAEMTLSGTGPTWDMSADEGGFYHSQNTVESLRVKEGMTMLGDSIFYDFSHLKSVTIPDSVTEIGNYTFENCTSLGPSLTISRHVKTVGNGAFCNCSKLASVTFLGYAQWMGQDIFTGCSPALTLSGWRWSDTEKYAEQYGLAFQQREIPEPDLFLPESLTTINSETFVGIKAKAPVIPASVTTIVGNPFEGSNAEVIYCYYRSEGILFALDYNYPFVPLGDAIDDGI